MRRSEKRLGASLLAGDTIVAFDNCNAPVNSPLICSALTQRWTRIRVLGLSRQADAPTSVLFTATGNNLILAGDLTRRSIRCELDAKCERPELREFDCQSEDGVSATSRRTGFGRVDDHSRRPGGRTETDFAAARQLRDVVGLGSAIRCNGSAAPIPAIQWRGSTGAIRRGKLMRS